MSKKEIILVVVGLVVGIVLGYAYMASQTRFGGVTNLDGLAIGSDGLTVSGSSTFGSGGTAIPKILFGTNCTFVGMNVSQAATTTAAYDCAVTGVVAGDTVVVQSPTTTPTTAGVGGWRITGANASSTSGFITVKWFNGTGGAAIPSATAVGSSTSYIVY